MAHETGSLTSWWAARPRRNPAGIGVAAGQAAIADGTIDERELRFVQLVGILISAEDITRVGALLPLLQTITTTLATDYADFISPGG